MDIIEQNESSSPIMVAEVAISTAPTSRTTKSAAVTKLLSRNKGATLGETMAITRWQPHSTRALLTELRKKGVDLLRETRSSDLLARSIAWRLQERVFGGLAPARVRELELLARQLSETGELDLERSVQLKPGTRLVWQWHERVYVVTVLDQGYDYEGRLYPSLTPIAREITGAAWSGPRFFGIKSRTGKGSNAEK